MALTGFTFLRVRGIPIQAHVSAVLLFVWVFWIAMGRFAAPEVETGTLLVMATACALLLFASIVLHELGHALWALREGMQVDGITLFALGGVAWLRPGGPYSTPRAYFLTVAAGPLVTLALVLVFGAAERAGETLGWPDPVLDVAGYLTLVNVVLLVFNLSPAYPLDGGQMLRAWLWRRSGDPAAAGLTAVRVATVTGYIAVGAAIVLLASGRLSAGFTAALAGMQILFLLPRLFRGAAPAAQRSQLEVVGDLLKRGPIALPEDSSVTDFLDRAGRTRGHSTHAFAVTRDGVLVGYTSLGLAFQIPAAERDRSTVGHAMVRWEEAIQLDPNTPLEQALEQLQGAGDRGIVVWDGRVIGIVLRQAIAEALLEAGEARRGGPEQPRLPWEQGKGSG